MKKYFVFLVLLVSILAVQNTFGQCSISVSAVPSGPICQGTSVTITASATGVDFYSWSNGQSGPSQTSITVTPASTTTYTVTGTGPFGCNTTDNITITVVTPGSTSITNLTPLTVCQGNWVMMQSDPADAYQWYRNGFPILGAIFQTYSDTLPGDYQCYVTLTPCTGIASNTLTVTVNPVPVSSFSPNIFLDECPPLITPFQADLTGPQYSYQWYQSVSNSGPWNPIPGATNALFIPPTGDFYYSVVVTNVFTGCAGN